MSDSIASDATIMNSSHSEAFDEPDAASSSVETTANLFNDSGAPNHKLATVKSGMLEIVLDRMLTVRDTETFSACLVFVQNSFNNEDCGGGGDRQLEPVARELVDKCLFMLNLASDEADDAACATILRFIIKLLDEQTANGRRMRVITPLISKVLYSVCALLLRSGDGAAYLQVVQLGSVCILKLVASQTKPNSTTSK